MKRCLGCMETYDDELEICPYCGYVEDSMPENAMHMVPGSILNDKYIIGKVVGHGGFGITYVAWDTVLERRVAVKEYLPGEFSSRALGMSKLTVYDGDKAQLFNDGKKKFLKEAQKLSEMQNESGIVSVYDSFEENNTAYIIMEYLEGITLKEYLETEKTIPEQIAIQMMMPIMKSLKALHAKEIIHRDIAPDNIMITANNQIKLIDFGAARHATTSHSKSLTVIIKQGYSPEEQYRSRGDQGPWTDVYAVGAVLYKMITGQTPPDSFERRAEFENRKRDILERPQKLIDGISENTENAILNAMNVRIEDRTQDMDTLIHELTTEDEVVRRNGKIKKIDILRWPLWLKIAVPTALTAVVTLLVLFLTGVIGFNIHSPREIYVPDGMTRVPRIVSMEQDEAVATLQERKIELVVSGKKYDEQISEGCVLTQEMTVGSVVPVNYNMGVLLSAGVRGVEAPFVTGFEKERAAELVSESELICEFVEEYDSVIPEGYISYQSVEGGTEVAVGSLMTLTVSLGRDPDEEYSFSKGDMPEIEGLSFDEAKALCEKQGILLVVSEYESSEEYDAMNVLTQSIAYGKDIQENSTVEVVLSKGKNTYIVPDVVYFTEEEAVAKLDARGLGNVIKYEESDNVAEGCVISQSIPAGTKGDKDTKVELTVSSGPPKFDMIDVVGKQHKDAEEQLHELGLIVTVDYVYNEEYELGTVVGQSEKKGAKVYKGCEIRITVVSDEALIKVPSVIGRTYDEAVELIEASGLKVEKNEVYDGAVEADTVISQTPAAESSQKKDTKILLTVSLGKQPVEVRLDAGGGECEASSKIVYYSETYGELPTPVLEHHTFLGWYTGKNSGSRVESGTSVETSESHTLYARWERIYVKVRFDANGGKVSESDRNMALGEKYTLPDATRQYYTFDGWYTASDGGSRIDGKTSLTNRQEHTLYAHWTVKTVDVKYDADGGSVSDSAQVTCKLGEPYGSKSATRTGYSFVGWYTEKNGKGTKILATTAVTNEKAHTLYAYWSNEVCTVSFNANGGSVGISSLNAVYDNTYGTLPTPVRTGYTFDGWYTRESGGEQVTENTTVSTTGKITLYAHWSNAKYKVSLNANGGSCSTASKTVEYSKAYGTLPTPTRTGYTFAGWYTASSGGSSVTADTIHNTTGNVTLYAHWSNTAYTVTFNANGGSCSTASKTVEYSKAYGTLPTPNKSGNTFEGWYTSSSGGSRVSADTIYSTAGNTTLYARWAGVYVTSVSLEKAAGSTAYYIGDKVSVAGASIKAVYNDGTMVSVSGSDCEVSYPDMSTEGSKTVKLSYGGKEASYTITVKKPTISISGGTNGSRTSTLTAAYEAGNQQSVSVSWKSSDTSVATVDENGKVTFNKDKGSNGSSTITASYTYMGNTYSASRTVSIQYGSWSSWSTTAVSASDTKQVNTRTSTRTKQSTNASEAGWTQIKKEKSYTSDWTQDIYDTQQSNTAGTEYELVRHSYYYWHYHNWYDGGWNIDSVLYGSGHIHEIDDCVTDLEHPRLPIGGDHGGRDDVNLLYGKNDVIILPCSYNFTLWWRKDRYVYRHRTYVWQYTHSQNYTEYQSRTISYTY
ncbi:MAG: InlB B-repeat-containing protein [Butyrivibrio sp.]|nr:InlB B-repeat-containing protein [Butyrivibrio sp.]